MTYLLLGRYGDLISILPFLKAESDSGDRPTLIVSNQHADLFDGVSYVNVVPFDGGVHLLRDAFEGAKVAYPAVKSLQTNGPIEDVREFTYRPAGKEAATCTSFVKEMWSLAGRLKLWDDVLPLVFDRRSPEREAALLKSTGVVGRPGRKKRLLLVSTSGTSSPFPYTPLLMELIRLRFGEEFHILELPKAERIYDLLALYERAHCLVCTDSAPLHLARAVPSLPVIALTNDRPSLWHGSSWLPQWAWCCRYHDFPERATEMLTAIEHCRDDSPYCELIIVWSNYRGDTPQMTYSRNLLAVSRGACGRDRDNVPELKDCLRMGLQRAEEDQVVCLVRSGVKSNGMEMGIAEQHEACFAYRISRSSTGYPPDSEAFSPVADLFCARKSWWKERLPEIPDLLLGNDYFWSECLRVMFQKHGAKDVTGVCYREK